jgi:hypothetical protein
MFDNTCFLKLFFNLKYIKVIYIFLKIYTSILKTINKFLYKKINLIFFTMKSSLKDKKIKFFNITI